MTWYKCIYTTSLVAACDQHDRCNRMIDLTEVMQALPPVQSYMTAFASLCKRQPTVVHDDFSIIQCAQVRVSVGAAYTCQEYMHIP
jgi:hypothetical protein